MGDEVEDDVSDVSANVHVDFEVNGLQTLDGKKCKPSKKYCKYNRQCCSGKCKKPPNPMGFKIELIGKCKPGKKQCKPRKKHCRSDSQCCSGRCKKSLVGRPGGLQFTVRNCL